LLEFLPPRVNAWKQFADRYISGRLAQAGAAAGAVAGIVALAFLVQQGMLWYWRSKWTAMKPRFGELDKMQQQIRQFRPWYDESFRSLTILKRLTEAFPDDGAVSAKSLEIREPSVITCTGTARNHDALIRTIDKLRATREISEVQIEQIRGTAPLEFTFNFHWDGNQGQ
jgi:hypothetical protein